jgi:hypothetical protein
MQSLKRWGGVSVALLLAASACTKEVTMSQVGPTVEQTPPTVSGLTIQGANVVFSAAGQTLQLTALVLMSNGTTQNQTSAATWSSDNPAVATVSNAGLVTAVGEGAATISATYSGQRSTFGVSATFAFRTPDPPPGQRIPKPNVSAIVVEMAGLYPVQFRNSCQDSGGTWEFMDLLIDRLRRIDTRWAYNGRRGDQNFVGRDEIAYHYSAGPDLNSREVYVWDVIVGHCGPNPQPGYLDMTDFGGIWLTRGRF